MGDAKKLVLRPISSDDARRIIVALHYSHKYCQNSQIHLGVFLDGKCGGALQFGPSLDKAKTIGLVRGTEWDQFVELNRLALANWLPRNSESRMIAVAMRFLRKTYPRLRWVLSFADGTQCGDGTIYRASGFVLTGIKKNTTIWAAPDGSTETDLSLRQRINRQTATKTNRTPGDTRRIGVDSLRILNRVTATDSRRRGSRDALALVCAKSTGGSSMKPFRNAGWAPMPGFQLRYIYFLDPTWRARLTVPEIPYSEIKARGAGMYRGKRAGESSSPGGSPPGEGGAIPTPPLQPSEEPSPEP
jgi:hypothetical protein